MTQLEVHAGFSHVNNFDLIRLVAASQVVVIHTSTHLGLPLPTLVRNVLECFPGVPIFFVVSGFLISASYQRSVTLSNYLRNRVLRLFPALWLVFFFAIALVMVSGYFSSHPPPLGGLLAWTASQLTFVQFYNPGFMRGYGVGVMNGSLWTLPVEMQFYALTPLLVAMLTGSRAARVAAAACGLLFVAANLLLAALQSGPSSHLWTRVYGVTFIPWFYMFMLGAALNMHWPRVRQLFESRFVPWLAAYLVLVAIDQFVPVGLKGNMIAPHGAIVLCGVVISAAFTRPQLAERLLKRNDISYGTYIYHMPIVNFLVELGWGIHTPAGWLVIPATYGCAWLSWRYWERPAMGLKNRTLLSR